MASQAQADSGAVTASEAMEELLNAQIVLRNNRRLQTAMRASRLPAVKPLAQFDFFQGELSPALVGRLGLPRPGRKRKIDPVGRRVLAWRLRGV